MCKADGSEGSCEIRCGGGSVAVIKIPPMGGITLHVGVQKS